MILLAVNRIEKYALSFSSIHSGDILELIEFDLLCGYIYFGCICFVDRQIGVTQGSLILHCIADMFLSCVD